MTHRVGAPRIRLCRLIACYSLLDVIICSKWVDVARPS